MRRQHVVKEDMKEGSAAQSSGESNLQVEFAALSDVGRVRDHNEDCLGHFLPEGDEQARHLGWLFVIADGVGGHERGEVASQMATERLTGSFREAVPGEAASATLTRLIQRANLEIYEEAMATGPAGKSMATTVVSCVLRYDRATIAHVGDSRCYLVRRGQAQLLTRDHTVSQEQLRMGLISVRDAAAAQTANILSRSLGTDLFVNVDVDEEQIYAGDVLILCSDGLHNSVREQDLVEALAAEETLNAAAAKLVGLARERDGKDNISVQLIRVKAVERVGLYRGRHYKLR